MIDATPLVRPFAASRRRRLARQEPLATQRATLMRLIAAARATRFGRDHDFARIASVEDFQALVPLRRYEDFWRDYWQPSFPNLVDCTWPGRIRFFALSSGTTTGRTKYIPVSAAMSRANARAGFDLIAHHLAARPDSRVFGGKIFLLGGSTSLTVEAPGIFSGDLSGIAARTMPWWARPFAFPPTALALLADWERKVERMALLALDQDIRVLAGTPSWLLILLARMAELRAARGEAGGPLPALELLVHGGVNFAPYRRRFEALVKTSGAELREVYPASEGFIASADLGPRDGLRLNLDHGLFFEFVPVAELDSATPTRHWLGNVETGVNYALVLSSCAGLWGYVLSDTVRLVSRAPPRLLITGRTSYMISAFGEHLIAEEVEAAVAAAAAAIGADVSDYAMGAIYPEAGERIGGHLYVVEFAKPEAADAIAYFAQAIDRALAQANDDYRAHRGGEYGMAPPRVLAVEPGFFAAWMKSRGKLGGQHKVPRLISDPALFAALRAFAAANMEGR